MDLFLHSKCYLFFSERERIKHTCYSIDRLIYLFCDSSQNIGQFLKFICTCVNVYFPYSHEKYERNFKKILNEFKIVLICWIYANLQNNELKQYSNSQIVENGFYDQNRVFYSIRK